MGRNVGRLVKKASNQLGRQFDQFAKAYDLTGMQMAIIDFLSYAEDKEYWQRDIEREFNIQRSTTTVLLQRMEKKQLIYRQVSQADARQKSVHLTFKAESLAKECQNYFQQADNRLEQLFSTQEIDACMEILHYYMSGQTTGKDENKKF